MTTVSQRRFSGGEIAPALYAGTDLTKYAFGARTLRNFLVRRHGGADNRPGSSWSAEVKDSSKRVHLIPFIFNDAQTCMLEFGNEYMRIHQFGSPVRNTAQNITAITNANPCVVTYSGSDTYSVGDHIYLTGIVGAIGQYLNNRTFRVAAVNTGTNAITLDYIDGTDVNSTSFGAYTSGGTIAETYEIATTYLEADLQELVFVQNADVITIVHPSYPVRELSRTGALSWSIADKAFGPSISAPTGLTADTGSGSFAIFKVTAVRADGEESLPSSQYGAAGPAPIGLSWNAVSGADVYRVYIYNKGIFKYLDETGETSYSYSSGTGDFSIRPPTAVNPYGSTDNYPSAVTYYQQRMVLAATNNDPENVRASRTNKFGNFTTNTEIQDDDGIDFNLVGRQVNRIRHLLDLGQLILMTTAGEWFCAGNSEGILTPTGINAKQQTYNGSTTLTPIIIDGNALYVQARGSVVRDLGFQFESDGYRGNDLTIFSAHLVDGYEITDWTYQQIPHSIVWAVRDDGVLLGLTYVREQQILAWHRHDTDGFVENVCSIPEGGEDAVYLVVKRTINGATKRYVERLNTRLVFDVQDSIFMDAAISYDGRNETPSHTMTLSGSGWTYEDTLTLTSSASYFSASEVGNEIHLTGSDGSLIRARITAYTNATTVSVKPNKTVPVSMRSTAISQWTRAVDELSGLWHLEGKSVSIMGDGYVVGNPNNPSYTEYIVTNGKITLEKCYGVIHVGLPYISDVETLDIDTVNGETLADKASNISAVTLHLEKSRGGWVGAGPPEDDDEDAHEGLTELKTMVVDAGDAPEDLITDKVDINIQSEWNSNGRVFIRQTDPLPMSVLAISPSGMIPFRG